VDDVLAQLAPRAPRRLLEELAQLSRTLAAAGRPRPEIELYLVSGPAIHGRLVEIAEDRGTVIATMLVATAPRTLSVSFVRVDQIAAVTVVDAALLARPLVADVPAPGRLELQRLLAARVEAITAAIGRSLPIELPADLDDDGRRAIAMVLPILADVLIAIGGDAMGRDALSALEAIELHPAASAEVARPDPRRLVLSAPKLLTELFTAASLRTELEKVL
jgi:hypothetical protein